MYEGTPIQQLCSWLARAAKADRRDLREALEREMSSLFASEYASCVETYRRATGAETFDGGFDAGAAMVDALAAVAAAAPGVRGTFDEVALTWEADRPAAGL